MAEKTNALAQRAQDAAPAMVPLRDQMAYAQTLAQGSLVPQSYRGNPANILVAMGLGQSMGLSPAESLYRINVIQGKPTASAELIAAQVRKAGHKLRIVKVSLRMLVRICIHRSELNNMYLTPMLANTTLTEERQSRRVKADGNTEHYTRHEGNKADSSREYDVEYALEEAICVPLLQSSRIIHPCN